MTGRRRIIHPPTADQSFLKLQGALNTMLDEKGWYNGYSPKERDVKWKALKQSIARGEVQPASGPCALCGDPDVPVEYHSEDYATEFRWTPPAMYALCFHCHRIKLHKRFGQPSSWRAFLAHVRRGGYARDLKDPTIKKEVQACAAALERGEAPALRPLRPYAKTAGEEWFSNLRMDPQSLADPSARPR